MLNKYASPIQMLADQPSPFNSNRKESYILIPTDLDCVACDIGWIRVFGMLTRMLKYLFGQLVQIKGVQTS